MAARYYGAELGFPLFGYIPFINLQFGLTPVNLTDNRMYTIEIVSWGSVAGAIGLVVSLGFGVLLASPVLIKSSLIALTIELLYVLLGSDTKKIKKILNANSN